MQWALDIDRRWIWAIIFIIIGIVIIHPLGLPITISPDTQQFYDTVQALPDGSRVLVGASFDVGAQGEILPMIRAFAYQAFAKNLKLYIFDAGWTNGPKLATQVVDQVAKEMGKQYGVDYVNLGYKPGSSTTYTLMTQDLMAATKGVDQNGKSLSDMPIMQGVQKVDKDTFALVFGMDIGTPGATDAWLPLISQPTGIPLVVGTITMSVPTNKPFLAAGQYKAMLDGSRGAAEYEALVGHPGPAIAQQDGASLAAMYVTLLIILANIAWVTTRKKPA
ncbi:MAG: hypothetical protein IRZ11_05050 [Clostridia bacterium]|nr:hypothetical protein [Clostridia bacterium]